MDKETLISLIPPTLTLIVTSLFGLFVGVLIEKFKNRYRTITYKIFTQKVKPSLSENIAGHLRINLGKREINTLKVVTINIENKSSIDLENLEVSFSLGKDSWFQGNEGFLQNNFGWLGWTEKYNEYYQKVLDDNNAIPIDTNSGIRTVSDELQQRIDYVLANRIYSIPVFNRKETGIFNFLIEDPEDGLEASITPSIIHKSVNFKEDIQDESQNMKDLWMTVSLGIIFVIAIISGIIYFNPQNKSLVIWAAIVGVSYSIVGYFILHGFRRIIGFFR